MDCLLSSFVGMLSAYACDFAIALEMKSLQNAGLLTGEPKMRILSVISRGTPLKVEFYRIIESRSLPNDANWSLPECSSLSVNLMPLIGVITCVFSLFSIAPSGRPSFLNWSTKKMVSCKYAHQGIYIIHVTHHDWNASHAVI